MSQIVQQIADKMPCQPIVGGNMYLWSQGPHYLEAEIMDDGTIELFYRNRQSRNTWGADVKPGAKLPDELWPIVEAFH